MCAGENILYFSEDSENVAFHCNEMVVLNIDFNNINLNNNFDEDDPDIIILMRLLAWHIKFEKRKALKNVLNEELMPVAWYLNRWWGCCVSKDEEKEIYPMFIQDL